MNWQAFGIAAAAITTLGFIPQILRGYKTKHLKDLSYAMSGLLCIGMGMWLVYGVARRDMVIVAANIAGVILNITIMGMKYYYSKTTEKAETSH